MARDGVQQPFLGVAHGVLNGDGLRVEEVIYGPPRAVLGVLHTGMVTVGHGVQAVAHGGILPMDGLGETGVGELGTNLGPDGILPLPPDGGVGRPVHGVVVL